MSRGSRGPLSQPRPLGTPTHKHVPLTIRCSSVVRTTKPRLTYAGAPGSEDGMSASKAAWQTVENLHAPSISKPDGYFAEKKLEFVHGGQDIDLQELNDVRGVGMNLVMVVQRVNKHTHPTHTVV